MALPALPTSSAPGCKQPQALVPDVQNPPVGIASRPLHPCCCPIWETVAVPSILQRVPRPSCAAASVVGAGPGPLRVALCSPYLLGPLTHMCSLQHSEHAPAPADTAPLSQPGSLPVAVSPGDGGKRWAATSRKGSAWPALGFSSCLCDSCTGKRGSDSKGLAWP